MGLELCGKAEEREPQMGNDTLMSRNSIRLYEQVADFMAARIVAGRYPYKLPSERELAEEFDVSYTTIRYVTAILRERDLIVSIHGRGTFNRAIARPA